MPKPTQAMSDSKSTEELREKLANIVKRVDALKTPEMPDGNPYLPGNLSHEEATDALLQLITTHIAKRVAAYHNDITDNERKVWLYSEDLQRRLLDARLDELGAVGYFSGVGLVHYNDDGSTVRKLELRIEDLEDERQKLEEKL